MENANRILFAADLHGNFEPVIQSVRQIQPEAVVLLGDYNLQQPLEDYLEPIQEYTQAWWIHGNHDVLNPKVYAYLAKGAYQHRNLHLTVREIAGLRIAGLGGIFIAKNWYPPGPSKWQHQKHWYVSQECPQRPLFMPMKLKHSIWRHEVERMQRSIQADILVTHEAPSCHRYGFSAIDELADAIGARYIFHGHQHEYYQDTVLNKIKVIGLAREMLVNLNGVVVSPGKLNTV